MKVSGFTFVRNAIKYGYPVVESIRSLLPVVDEMIVCLGNSEDDTEALIRSIGSEKIRIVHSTWDDSLREEGKVLAVETNKAMDATSPDSDWLFYIQADEVLHEQYYPAVLSAMQRYKDDKKVEGLLFYYHHFYGSYRFIGDGRKWYSKEIRVIRNDKRIRSYKDAQGFRFEDNHKLKVKLADAYIYHYGWVRNPLTMFRKFVDFGKLWTPEEVHSRWVAGLSKKKPEYDYLHIDSVGIFKGTHPAVMRDLVNKEDWNLDIDTNKKNFKNLKHRILYFIWRKFRWKPFEYANYIKI